YAITDALGVSLRFDLQVSPRDDGNREPLAVAPTNEGIRNLIAVDNERYARAHAGAAQPEPRKPIVDDEMPAASDKHCGAGSAGIAIDPYGNVYPCVQWRRPVGNLHQQSIREIWTGSAGLREVRELTAQAKQVVDAQGAAGPLLNFCPGMAATRTGDPLSLYPDAIRRAEVLGEVLEREKKRKVLPVLP